MTLRDQLMRDEGLRLKAYVDTRGKTTVGYGRNLTDAGLSFKEAQMLLDNDIARITAEVVALLPWIKDLDEVRQAALLNMAFNVGPHGLLESPKMLRHAQAGEWAAAAAEMVSGPWSQQVGARAIRLQRQLESGEWT